MATVIAVKSSPVDPASSCEILELTHSTPTAATTAINPIDEDRTVMRKMSELAFKLCLCVSGKSPKRP